MKVAAEIAAVDFGPLRPISRLALCRVLRETKAMAMGPVGRQPATDGGFTVGPGTATPAP